MIRRSCQVVPALCALLMGSGCYLIHGGAASDPPRDAGRMRPVEDAAAPPPRIDAGSLPDAGPIPPSCTLAPLDVACTDNGNAAIPVGVPYELPVYLAGVDACLCGQEIDCRATVAPDGVIELTTHVCVEIPCEACGSHIAGTCPLPPLSEGVHRVIMNGALVFDLNVSNARPGEGPFDECQSHPVDVAGCGWSYAPRIEEVDQICFANEAPAGEPIPIAVTDFCLPCGDSVGPCRVTRTADSVHVTPTRMPPACEIDCDMECSLVESECFIPPLEPGEYTVTLEGMPGSAPLHVTGGGVPRPGNSCLSVPEDP